MTVTDPVSLAEISMRLGRPLRTVEDWADDRHQFFPPFPPPVLRVDRVRFYDWRLVSAWYERTHELLGRRAPNGSRVFA